MRDRTPPIQQGDAYRVVDDAEKVLREITERQQEQQLAETILERYRQQELVFPPLLAGYLEYCAAKGVPPDIMLFACDPGSQNITPPDEKRETDAIITAVIVCTRIKTLPPPSPNRQKTLLAILETLLETIDPRHSEVLREILSYNKIDTDTIDI